MNDGIEFAAGTGRVALALRARGVDVAGIERSRPMVDHLRAQPGADDVPVVIGDMTTTTRVDGSFSLVYLVFNTMRPWSRRCRPPEGDTHTGGEVFHSPHRYRKPIPRLGVGEDGRDQRRVTSSASR